MLRKLLVSVRLVVARLEARTVPFHFVSVSKCIDWLKHIICHLSVFAGQWLDLKASHFNSGACQGYCQESGIFLWRADGISHGWLRTILVSKIFNFSKAVFVDGFTFNAFILRWWKEKRHFLTVTCKWPIIDVIKLPNFAQLLLHFFFMGKTDR